MISNILIFVAVIATIGLVLYILNPLFDKIQDHRDENRDWGLTTRYLWQPI